VRRAGDDRPTRVDRIEHYIEPGAMWWAFDAASASRRGLRPGETLDPPLDPARDRGIGPTGQGTVILIDEIDKADPDLPNNLLEPLGSLQFTVQETGRRP